MYKLTFEKVLEKMVKNKIKANEKDKDVSDIILTWEIRDDYLLRFKAHCIFKSPYSEKYIIGHIEEDGDIHIRDEKELLKSYPYASNVTIQIAGHIGTWEIIKIGYYHKVKVYLLRHEQYEDEVFYLIADTLFRVIGRTTSMLEVTDKPE